MEKRNALYVSLCAAIIGVEFAFTLPAFSPMRMLWYFPLEHRWAYDNKPAALAMDWYGRTLFGLVAGVLAFAVAWSIFSRFQKISQRTLTLWAGWMATAVLLAMSVNVYQLALRHPKPEPIPNWYSPR